MTATEARNQQTEEENAREDLLEHLRAEGVLQDGQGDELDLSTLEKMQDAYESGEDLASLTEEYFGQKYEVSGIEPPLSTAELAAQIVATAQDCTELAPAPQQPVFEDAAPTPEPAYRMLRSEA